MSSVTSAFSNPLSNQSLPEELPIQGFDVIEFYVGNALQTARFYHSLFGFDILAFRGPESGVPDTASYLLQQNDIRWVVTSALQSNHPITQHVMRHGDGVKDIGLRVDDVDAVYQVAIARGARSVTAPYILSNEHGTVKKATIATYGDTTHTFVERTPYTGPFEPGYLKFVLRGQSTGLNRVDHLVGNLETGTLDQWVSYYQQVFGFQVFQSFDKSDISTEYSALVSHVMSNHSGTVKMPLNEPAEGVRKSQIQEFLDFYHAPGVQHMAIETENILTTVAALRERGVPLMNTPDAYYAALNERVGDIAESMEQLAKLNILVDREDEGYLLQIFTRPLQDRPTFFLEIIQRHGAEGFGKGNFKALFEAIEQDQYRRGNA